MDTVTINVQFASPNPRSFVANFYRVVSISGEIICDFIFEDKSNDDAVCITAVFSPETILEMTERFDKMMTENPDLKMSFDKCTPSGSWKDFKKVRRESPHFRSTVLFVFPHSDIYYLSLGFVHPRVLHSVKEQNAKSVIASSLAEISIKSDVFAGLYQDLLALVK